MPRFPVHEAKRRLAELVERALAGEEIVVMDGDVQIALIPLLHARDERRIGGAEGVIPGIADDFDAPLEDFEPYMR